MTDIEFEIVTSDGPCPWCEMAISYMKHQGHTFFITCLDTPEKKSAFKEAGFITVPQIYRNGTLIGGYKELVLKMRQESKAL